MPGGKLFRRRCREPLGAANKRYLDGKSGHSESGGEDGKSAAAGGSRQHREHRMVSNLCNFGNFILRVHCGANLIHCARNDSSEVNFAT
jgi:hypothetical protein